MATETMISGKTMVITQSHSERDLDNDLVRTQSAKQDPGYKELAEYVRKVKESPSGELGCTDVSWLFLKWLSSKTKLFFDVWILIFLTFYVDFTLDLKMMFTFYHYEDYQFMVATIAGIVLAVFFTLSEMSKAVSEGDPPWLILVAGFLLPSQFHVLFLCCVSTWKGRVHPLLHAFKLAEACVEGTVGALVQTYALIFRDMEWDDKVVGYVSSLSSYASIAWAITQFDIRDKGLSGLPGVATGTSDPKLWVVFVFRVCEICSRVVSLGLFQLAMRDEVIFAGFTLGHQGGLAMLAMDFVIMFMATCYYQLFRCQNYGNLPYSILSAIVFTNPMLLDENAFTIPAWLYFLIRALELGLMGSMAWHCEVFHGLRDGLETRDHDVSNNLVHFDGLVAEFHNDKVLIYGFFISTTLGALLLLIIRCWLTDNVFLIDDKVFRSHAFSVTEDNLFKQVLEGPDAVEFDGKGDKLLRDAESNFQQAMDDLRKTIPDTAVGGSNGFHRSHRVLEFLYTWLASEWERVSATVEEKTSVGERFVELACLGHNMHGWLKQSSSFAEADTPSEIPSMTEPLMSRDGDARSIGAAQTTTKIGSYLRYLRRINSGLQQSEVQVRLTDPEIAKILLRILPPVRQWRKEDPDFQRGIRLFEQKCTLIQRVLRYGWQSGVGFVSIARQFHDEFHCLTQEAIKERVQIVDDETSGVDAFDWYVHVQTSALVGMWDAIPEIIKKQPEEIQGLFLKEREVKALMEGIKFITDDRDKLATGILEASNKGDVWTDALVRALKAMDDELIVQPANNPVQVDLRHDLDQNLGILTSLSTTLKVFQVRFTPAAEPGKSAVTKLEDVRQKTDLMSCLYGGGKELQIPVGSRVEFHMVRMKEVDVPDLDHLRMHETVALRLFKAVRVEDLTKRFGFKSDEPQFFYDCKSTVEQECLGELKRIEDMFEQHIKNKVDPKSAVGELELYRNYRDELSSQKKETQIDPKRVAAARGVWTRALNDIEKLLNESLKPFLQKMSAEFSWSKDVCAKIHEMEQLFRVMLDKQRESKFFKIDDDKVSGAVIHLKRAHDKDKLAKQKLQDEKAKMERDKLNAEQGRGEAEAELSAAQEKLAAMTSQLEDLRHEKDDANERLKLANEHALTLKQAKDKADLDVKRKADEAIAARKDAQQARQELRSVEEKMSALKRAMDEAKAKDSVVIETK
eukprot:TRINITY_DN31366_c0_g1_i1.p1 TRINITY_DN31366_c0_g1~~TRINITY_DN31366_c0_g1_i1.p1  ORF type:complete len:1194 (+),score=221.79 TRINITY_DN31366_c0_g1_i1:44-3625(+)